MSKIKNNAKYINMDKTNAVGANAVGANAASTETTTFNQVKQLRNDLTNIFTEIDSKVQILNQIYEDLVKTHQDKNYTLGLDSFHFQNKLIYLEYENMKTVFNFIDNRIYCEYYKLHRMLFDFIIKDIKEKSFVDKLLIAYKKYPIYKDLEPLKIYDFNVTAEINNAITHAIMELKAFLTEKQQELSDKKRRSEIGINIQSILHEQVYHNIILEERIHMFENYLNTFNAHHSKYFSRLTIKMKLMLGIVNEDFHLKKSKSLHVKRNTKRDNINTLDTISESASESSSSSEAATPKTSMTDGEENNVRLLIGAASSTKEIRSELDTILRHIPQEESVQEESVQEESAVMENKELRDTIAEV